MYALLSVAESQLYSAFHIEEGGDLRMTVPHINLKNLRNR